AALGGDVRGRRLGVLGLAFKANTDDMRDSPALTILPQLVDDGAEIVAYDPKANDNAAPLLPGITLVGDTLAAIEDADAVIVLTEWNEFRSLNWEAVARRMRAPLVIDLRNIYDPLEMAEAKVTYVSLGRSSGDTPLAAAAAE